MSAAIEERSAHACADADAFRERRGHGAPSTGAGAPRILPAEEARSAAALPRAGSLLRRTGDSSRGEAREGKKRAAAARPRERLGRERAGSSPFPIAVPRDHPVGALRQGWPGWPSAACLGLPRPAD
jgi:hypothetical protein